jgi:hypothetical protein
MVVNFKDDAFYRFFVSASIAEHIPMNPDEILDENCFLVLWQELVRINEPKSRIDHVLAFCAPSFGEMGWIKYIPFILLKAFNEGFLVVLLNVKLNRFGRFSAIFSELK